MNTATVTFVIYFVGIAAFVDTPDKTKLAIFPVAQNGAYDKVMLWKHTTFLHVRGEDLVKVDPVEFCTGKGTWNEITGVCSIELRGATLSTQTAEPLTFDESFADMPSFGRVCPGGPNVKRVKRAYTEDADPDFVAARFELTGGNAGGCSRAKGAFVTRLAVPTTDGILTVSRGGAPLRIRLKNGARIAIENRPAPGQPAHAHQKQKDHPEHYGWYYFIASGNIGCPIKIPDKARVGSCGDIPGVYDGPAQSATGPDCGNTGYP